MSLDTMNTSNDGRTPGNDAPAQWVHAPDLRIFVYQQYKPGDPASRS